MVYRAIGLMSGSSLDGLDIVFASFTERGGQWTFKLEAADCFPYEEAWKNRLSGATLLSAREYCLLDIDFGHYVGEQVNQFLENFGLQYQVSVIGSHGHTSFHMPTKRLTAQLGNGAALAACTGLPVVNDLRAMDVALGGQGAPIVPMGEKFLFPEYELLMNIGGIANISLAGSTPVAFDICPANRVLNLLAQQSGQEFDKDGELAATGTINERLLQQLNAFSYYQKPFPKSLANEMGTHEIFPLLQSSGSSLQDQLSTYVAHIAVQTTVAVQQLLSQRDLSSARMLVTGGGAFNSFLMQQIREQLLPLEVSVVIPDASLVQYKEALIMGFLAVLRWRQESTVLSSVTGASRDSIGGALWNGQGA